MGYSYKTPGKTTRVAALASGTLGTPGKRTRTENWSAASTEAHTAQLQAASVVLDSVRDLASYLSGLDEGAPNGEAIVRSIEINLDQAELLAQRVLDAGAVGHDAIFAQELLRNVGALREQLAPYFDRWLPTSEPRQVEPNTPETGIPLVDDGFACEDAEARTDDGKPGCFLTERQRERLLDTLDKASSTAMANLRDAIQDARIDHLTKTEAGWGFLAEVIFYSVTGVLIGGVLKAVKTINAQGVRVDAGGGIVEAPKGLLANEEFVAGALQQISKGVRAEMKNNAKALSADNRGKAAFLQIVREKIKPMEDALISTVSAQLSDVDLVALTHAFLDQETNSIAAYRAEIDALVAGYDDNRIGDIGKEHRGGGTIETMKLVYKGRERLAIFDVRGTGVVLRQRGDQFHANGETIFLKFVDEAFVDLAAGVQAERTGKEVPTVDITNGHDFQDQSMNRLLGSELRAWIEQIDGEAS